MSKSKYTILEPAIRERVIKPLLLRAWQICKDEDADNMTLARFCDAFRRAAAEGLQLDEVPSIRDQHIRQWVKDCGFQVKTSYQVRPPDSLLHAGVGQTPNPETQQNVQTEQVDEGPDQPKLTPIGTTPKTGEGGRPENDERSLNQALSEANAREQNNRRRAVRR